MAMAKQPPLPNGTQVSVQVASGFSGPIPPPNLLQEYDKAFPGSAERIVKMAEVEQAHRHAREHAEAELQISIHNGIKLETTLGQFFALIIGVVAIIAGTIAGVHGAQFVGTVIGGGGVGGLVTAFIVGRRLPKA